MTIEISEQSREIFLKRLKSFLWRSGCMGVIALLAWFMEHINLLELPIWAVGLVGLAVSEITKHLNNATKIFGIALKK